MTSFLFLHLHYNDIYHSIYYALRNMRQNNMTAHAHDMTIFKYAVHAYFCTPRPGLS